MSNTNQEHLSDRILQALNAGTLADSEIERVAEHIETCDACAGKLTDHLTRVTTNRDLSIDESRMADLLLQINLQTQDESESEPVSLPQLEHVGPTMRGGLGEVTVYRDVQFDRQVAVKTLRREAAFSPARVQRFRLEYEITAQLQNRGVPSVYARGTLPDEREYYVMQFIQGKTLQDCVNEFHAAGQPISRGCRDFVTLVNQLISVAETIGAAHRRSILHRDLKPLNIVIDDDDRAIVLDWGLACRIGDRPADLQQNQSPEADGDNLTVDGIGMGTVAYMSPEQAAGDSSAYDRQTDVYGLGAMLFEMLTGSPPHGQKFLSATTTAERMQKIAGGHHPQPQGDGGIPRELVSICRRAIHPDKDQRTESADALIQDLQAWLSLNPVQAHSYSVGESITRVARRFPRVMFASLAVLTVGGIAAGSAAYFIQGQRETIRTDRTKFMLNLSSMIEVVRPELNNLSQEAKEKFVRLSRESLPDLYAADTDSPQALRAAARARHTEAILLLDETEDPKAACDLFEDAYRLIRDGRTRFPNDIEIQGTEIDIMISLSRSYSALNDTEAARALAISFTERLNQLAKVLPKNGARYLNELTRASIGTGDILANEGYSDECIALLREAIAAAPLDVVLNSKQQSFFDSAWIIRQNLILELRDTAPDKAVVWLAELRSIQEASPRGAQKRNVTHLQDQIWVEKYHADIFRRTDRLADAKTCLENAERVLQDLRRDDQDNRVWSRDLADISSRLAALSGQLGEEQDELKYLRRDYDLSRTDYRTSALSTRNFASVTCRRLAEFYARQGDAPQARKFFNEGRAALEPHLKTSSRKMMIAFKSIVDSWSKVLTANANDLRQAVAFNEQVAEIAATFVQSDAQNLLNHEAVTTARWQQIDASRQLLLIEPTVPDAADIARQALHFCDQFAAAQEIVFQRMQAGTFRQKAMEPESSMREKFGQLTQLRTLFSQISAEIEST